MQWRAAYAVAGGNPLKPAAGWTNFQIVLSRWWAILSGGWIAPAVQTPANEHIRRGRNLAIILGLIAVSAAAICLLSFFSPPIPFANLREGEIRLFVGAGIMLLAAAAAYLMARRWSVEAAAFLFLSVLTVMIAVSDAPQEVAEGRTLIVFTLPILAAGAVLPPWSPFIFAGFASLAMVIVGQNQVDAVSYLISSMTLFLVAGIAWLSASSLAHINVALRLANQHLRQSENDFRLLFADNPLPMMLIDLQTFRVAEANQAAIAQSGLSREEMLHYATSPFFKSETEEAVAAIAQGKTFNTEQQLRTGDGQVMCVAITAHRVVYGGQQVALVIVQDITARYQAEEALRTLNSELEQRVEERTTELREANIALERSSRHKDEFLATMSHELRTPLTGILGSADVLTGDKIGQLNPRQERAIKLIQESGEHLLSLINSVLDLSKLEVGKLSIDIEPLLVRDVCLSALHMVQPQAKSKEQIVTLVSTPDNFWLQADARRLKQILINLLGNAVKFTPEAGSIRLDVQADFVGGTVTFTVTDNGIGIAADDLPHLFQPFYQINSGLSRLYGGAGLGLALVQRLVQLHGGSVTVVSTPGQGSQFAVLLPCRPKPLAPAPSLTAAQVDASIPDLAARYGRRLNVLLAEDHAASVEVLRSILELTGCDLTVAVRGDSAVECVQATPFDLVLMDVQMPVMDGLTAMSVIRGLPTAAARTPIIALTAMALWGDRERCLAAGANDYVSKPIDLDRLFEVMQQQLDPALNPGPANAPLPI